MLALTVLANVLRWWCIATLGERWTARVIVVPGAPLVRSGPYRWFAHPNYVAVIVEGFALPLTGSAWITATAFTVLNAALLTVRIRCEVERSPPPLPEAPGPPPCPCRNGGVLAGPRCDAQCRRRSEAWWCRRCDAWWYSEAECRRCGH